MNAVPVSEPTPQIPNDPSASTPATPARCLHRWPSGRRCRRAPEHLNSSFCATHAAVEQNRHHGDRLHDLLLQTDNRLRTASDINNSLASLYVLLAEDRISARRASVLAYISSLMLRTLPAVEKEDSHDGSQIIVDLPRPSAYAEPEIESEPYAPIAPPPLAQVHPDPRRAFVGEALAPPGVNFNHQRIVRAVGPESAAVVRPESVAAPSDDSGPSSVLAPTASNATPPHPYTRTPAPNPVHDSYPIYRDANYDDHWFPTAHVIKTTDEIERQRFAPKSPHPDAQPDARKPAT